MIKYSLPDTFLVKVNTSKLNNKIIGFNEGMLIVDIKAKPIEGEANKVLLHFLKKELKDNYTIVSGIKSRIKKVSKKSV